MSNIQFRKFFFVAYCVCASLLGCRDVNNETMLPSETMPPTIPPETSDVNGAVQDTVRSGCNWHFPEPTPYLLAGTQWNKLYYHGLDKNFTCQIYYLLFIV